MSAQSPLAVWWTRWNAFILGALYAPSFLALPLILPEVARTLSAPVHVYGWDALALAVYSLLSFASVAACLLGLIARRCCPWAILPIRIKRVVVWALVANLLPHLLALSLWSLSAAISEYGLID